MLDLEMRLGEEIVEAVDKNNMVVFRNDTTKQPYALFKLKDEPGAVVELSNGLYVVEAKHFSPKKEEKDVLF